MGRRFESCRAHHSNPLVWGEFSWSSATRPNWFAADLLQNKPIRDWVLAAFSIPSQRASLVVSSLRQPVLPHLSTAVPDRVQRLWIHPPQPPQLLRIDPFILA